MLTRHSFTSIHLGMVSIIECIPGEFAQFEYVSYLIHNLLIGQRAPKQYDIHGREIMSQIMSEEMVERILPCDFAILFRKNESGHKLKKYLRRNHADIKLKWHKTPNEG